MSITHSSHKIFLDSSSPSAHKINNSNYVFDISPPLLLHPEDKHKMVLGIETASIPLSFYTINSKNNRFSIDSIEYEIPEGNYRVSQLTPVLNGLMGSKDLTFVFNEILSKYQIQSTTLTSIVIDNVEDHADILLGFSVGSHDLPYRFEEILNLTYTSGITIRFNNITTNNIDTYQGGLGGSTIIRLPITSPPNTMLQYFNNTPFLATINNRSITQLNVSLHDDEREFLSLNGDHQFFLTIRVDYIRVDDLVLEDTLFNAFRKALDETPIRGDKIREKTKPTPTPKK